MQAALKTLPPYARRFVMRAGLLPLVLLISALVGVARGESPTAAEPASISAAELAAVKAAEAARVAAIESVYGSVVAIYGNDRQGGGSGVLYDAAGYALTNHHVVAAAGDEGWAGLADGKLYRWKLFGTDPGGDVAIIRLLGRSDFPTARLGDSEMVRVGDWAMAMGNPFVLAEDQRPTVTLGIVSGVHRYQPGDGLNTLVYGNCIQVDSSINPGNSGGPLFNLRGEVIGINGRGSFEERGRVNVGLGYAISANQIKTFIPDLLATKVAQHGTLDAQFGNRTGGVICQTLNLNAPIARLGLELGDRLIAFEGTEITNANQFTNLITTYPADWPCEVTFEHAGERKTVHVRLTPLPYDLAQAAPAPPKPGEPSPMPGDGDDQPRQPEQEKLPIPAPKDEAREPEQPDEQPETPETPADRKEIKPVQIVPQRAPLEPGKVRFPELNRDSLAHLLQQWQAGTGTMPAALQVTEEIRSQGKIIGSVDLHLAADQRFVIRYQRRDQRVVLGFDGESFWKQEGSEQAATLSAERALRDPYAAYALAMTVAARGSVPSAAGAAMLEGGDKAQQQVAYRIALRAEGDDPLYLWLSVFDPAGPLGVSLLKSGVGIYDDEPVPAFTYHDWRSAAGYRWPHRKRAVKGLAETRGEEVVTTQVQAADITDEVFRMPKP